MGTGKQDGLVVTPASEIQVIWQVSHGTSAVLIRCASESEALDRGSNLLGVSSSEAEVRQANVWTEKEYGQWLRQRWDFPDRRDQDPRESNAWKRYQYSFEEGRAVRGHEGWTVGEELAYLHGWVEALRGSTSSRDPYVWAEWIENNQLHPLRGTLLHGMKASEKLR